MLVGVLSCDTRSKAPALMSSARVRIVMATTVRPFAPCVDQAFFLSGCSSPRRTDGAGGRFSPEVWSMKLFGALGKHLVGVVGLIQHLVGDVL
jgi:hypothetical protein